MTLSRARMLARRRTLVLVCLVVLVWCQVAAAAHAATMAVSEFATQQVAAEMMAMPGCDAPPATGSHGKATCPASDAMPDWTKLPVFLPLHFGNAFTGVPVQDRSTVASVRYEMPQGRAPPRSMLCSWLI